MSGLPDPVSPRSSSRETPAKAPERSGLLSELIASCLSVQGRLGPGCPRSVYLESLVRELRQRGIFATRPNPGRPGTVSRRRTGNGPSSSMPGGFDLLVEASFAIELAELSEPAFRRDPQRRLGQFSELLQRSGLEAGLLVDFNQPDPTDGLWLARAPVGTGHPDDHRRRFPSPAPTSAN